jgi:hypothetical protein
VYADDLKVIFPIDLSNSANSHSLIMHDLHNLSLWSEATGLCFNFNICVILHYGNYNPNFVYNVCDHLLPTADNTTDLGVTRCANLSYDIHCMNLIRRANSICGYILSTFASRNASFMTGLFIAYVRPILE